MYHFLATEHTGIGDGTTNRHCRKTARRHARGSHDASGAVLRGRQLFQQGDGEAVRADVDAEPDGNYPSHEDLHISVSPTPLDGNTQTWEPFRLTFSQLTVVDGAIELKKK